MNEILILILAMIEVIFFALLSFNLLRFWIGLFNRHFLWNQNISISSMKSWNSFLRILLTVINWRISKSFFFIFLIHSILMDWKIIFDFLKASSLSLKCILLKRHICPQTFWLWGQLVILIHDRISAFTSISMTFSIYKYSIS